MTLSTTPHTPTHQVHEHDRPVRHGDEPQREGPPEELPQNVRVGTRRESTLQRPGHAPLHAVPRRNRVAQQFSGAALRQTGLYLRPIGLSKVVGEAVGGGNGHVGWEGVLFC